MYYCPIKTKEKIIKLDLLGDKRDIKEIIKDKKSQMNEAAEELQFELAMILRDEIKLLEKELWKKK